MATSTITTNDDEKQSDSLSIFCREVRNLLRSKPNCMVPFSKFVPAYHNHYGRQCCVYQFGYTKLIELLESIPHVVQIVGDGTNRYITLTHREQIKRFASDLIKVVKSQPGKKLKLSQFARAYEHALGRQFRVEDYGTNNINVLLAEIWEGTINIMPIKRELIDTKLVSGPLFVNSSSNSGGATGGGRTSNSNNDSPVSSSASSSLAAAAAAAAASACSADQLAINKPYITDQYPDAWFEIPKRERSDKEIKRTKYFVWDVIELLSSIGPNYSVPFSKFIPSYHYYFNRQCKVSIFGFSKLIDLFESISPDVVEIIDQGPGEEKIIKLADRHVPMPNRTRNRTRHHYNHHPTSRPTTTVSGYRISSSSGCGGGNNNNNSRSNNNNNTGSKTSNKGNNNSSGEGDGADQNSSSSSSAVSQSSAVASGGSCAASSAASSAAASSASSCYSVGDSCTGDDLILPAQAMDCGPTLEELMELEMELEAYEELKISKRSSRMAAILDVFKYSNIC